MKNLTRFAAACVMQFAMIGWACAEGGKPFGEQILGFWEIDKDAVMELAKENASNRTQLGMRRMLLEDLELLYTVEIRKAELIFPWDDDPRKMKYIIKSRDAATGAMEMDVTDEEGKVHACSGKAIFEDGKLILSEIDSGQRGEGMTWSSWVDPMVLIRVDRDVFERRSKLVAKMSEPKADGKDGGERKPPPDAKPDAGAGPAPSPGSYVRPEVFPAAKPVPGKEGFVFSPFNNTVIDVRKIPPGTLVQDPAYPASEKKYFRIPGSRD